MLNNLRRFLTRKVCAGALILMLGLLAYKAGLEGLSNFYVQSARMELDRWSLPGQRLQGDEGALVAAYLGKSLRYAPDNPWALEETGAIQLGSLGTARDAQVATAAARGANTNFHLALMARPTSPFTWANLALSKLYLGEQDAELFGALQRAELLGPWEPGVQQAVIFVGLSVWNRIDPALQATVFRAMQRGARRNPGKIAEMAQTFNRMDLFCAIKIRDFQGSKELCGQVSKSAKNPGSNKDKKGRMP